jgi:hypothetical protein
MLHGTVRYGDGTGRGYCKRTKWENIWGVVLRSRKVFAVTLLCLSNAKDV